MPFDRGGPERTASEAQSDRRVRGHSSNDPVDGTAATDRIPRPSWVPTDGVIAPSHDRQVLVVGTTPTGLTLARLLRAAGYDPVLARGSDATHPARITYLPPAAVEVVGALDLGERLLDRARRITRATVRVARGDGDRRGEPGGSEPGTPDRAPPVVVPTRTLRRILRDGIDDAAVADGRTVGSLSPGDDGVAATFGDGVRECFDLAVDACGAATRPEHGVKRRSLVRYEATHSAGSGGSAVEEVRGPAVAVRRLPGVGGTDAVVRITTSETEATVDGIRRRVAADDRVPFDVPGADSLEGVRSEFAPLPEPPLPDRWWGCGRIARCGPAACPAASAAGMGAALGITDALGVVWALARTESAVRAAVDGYSARRAQRLTGLRSAATAGDRAAAAPDPPDSGLESVYALRAIGLEPFFGTAPTALHTAGKA
ncbi:FAD-dependent oxidoreductase [Halobellus ruber]|uniref:FAD-dependent monooxygenase n=1 Tax=Halobellus ruber TaxID=2761102 RepID=A0A7J9SJH3_9EURY|nr:FAD-dependent monooxygenase [Halobellus ruber]MBB6646176.1 FAD-dependent monooxygenase [Halobellus ruber]